MNRLLDAAVVAALLGISRAAAYREMKKMQHVVIGERTLRVTEAAVEGYVRQRTKTGSPQPLATARRKSANSALPSAAPRTKERPELRVVQPRTRPRLSPSPIDTRTPSGGVR